MKKVILNASLLALLACNAPEQAKNENDSTHVAATDTAATKAPTFTIEEADIKPKTLMVMNDSAKSTEEIGQKLGMIFGKISECAGKCKMTPAGPPFAWYSSVNAPWKFTAGMPYTSKCAKPEAGISNKELKGGKAVVVHYYGPYEMSSVGYEAGEKYIKEHNLFASEAPYEVYVGDPMVEKDPYKVLTDIVFPVK